jgi:DNA-binding PadR family transcriptional regulator
MAMTDERKLLLLGLLRQSEMHGYMLNAHLDGSVPISLKKPTAYNLLDRMEEDGWVEHRDEPTGDRPRKVYSVTKDGEQAFHRLLRKQLKTFAPGEFPSVVSLSFLDAIPAPEALELLKQRRVAIEQYRDGIVTHEGNDAATNEHHTGSAHLSIEYARRFIEMESRFLDEVLEHLEST